MLLDRSDLGKVYLVIVIKNNRPHNITLFNDYKKARKLFESLLKEASITIDGHIKEYTSPDYSIFLIP